VVASNGLSTKLQSCRYELKYLIDERTAQRAKSFVLQYLNPDEHTNPDEGFGYPVHSLYLDSPDYKLCRSVLTGDKNRFKIRVRFYDDSPNPDTAFFFEIKRRVNDVIMKQRAAVWRTSATELIAGRWPRRSDLLKDDDKNFRSLYNFCSLAKMLDARPAAYVSYLREAYEPSDSNAVRVTFDRRILAGEYRGQLGIRELQRWGRPDVGGEVVMELKFTDRYPEWMHDAAQLFGLRRGSCPKYVSCVTILDQAPLMLRQHGQKQKVAV
jgi:hypothetical protein